MKKTITILRTMKRTGQHLYDCFAEEKVRQRGWKMIQTTNRAARRLGLSGLICLSVCVARAECPSGLPERMADAIYIAEGGAKTAWPYGVKSVRCATVTEARRVTITSVRNNWRRWEQAGKPGDFVSFMAARWCPATVDPVGNRNWVKNVKGLLK